MSTFEVKIRKVIISPHSNADSLELAQVDDYRCVVKKGEYTTGNLVVYVPEAAIIPNDVLELFGFWDKEKNIGVLKGPERNRVGPVRLRGELSQGMVFPVDSGDGKPFITLPTEDGIGTLYSVQEGQDVAEVLGITKWSPPIPTHMSGEVYNAGQHLTVAYDIENVKKYPNILQDGEQVVFTEKIHGSFLMVGILPEKDRDEKHFEGRFVIASKGLGADGLCFKSVEVNEKNVYIRALRKCGIFDKLDAWANNPSLDLNVPFFLLGEVYGNVQDLGYGTDLDFRVFDIVSGYRGEQVFAGYHTMLDIVQALGIQIVPLLYSGRFNKDIMLHYTSGHEAVSGKSSHLREGIVIKPIEERYDDEIGRVILKSVSEQYLLRKNKNATEFN